jgi:hypothetical protein
MEGTVQAEGTHKLIKIPDVSWNDIEGIFIRAAIRYLSELSSKNISSQLLINEGILPPGSFQGSESDEVIVITNYRVRIEEAIRLLTSWVDGVKSGGAGLRRLPLPSEVDWQGFEMPIADSILPPGVTPIMLAMMRETANYRIDRIPKTMPPVLSQLKLEGLHHYLTQDEEFNYQQSMEVVVFMDRAVQEEDFPGDEWYVGERHFIGQMKDVFRACLADNVVTIN